MSNGAKGSCIRIWRMAEIAKRIRLRTPFTVRDLSKEIEVGEKTLRRDLDFMRDFLGYRIWFDGSNPRKRIL